MGFPIMYKNQSKYTNARKKNLASTKVEIQSFIHSLMKTNSIFSLRKKILGGFALITLM